jgi:putative FmdB family regulatory protein
MPIYAYRCEACGHAKDVLQKMSDPVLSTCPSCGADAFRKQVTAAGFQLKGSGWYVTDFRGGNAPAAPVKSDSGGSESKTDAPAAAPATATPAASGGDGAGKSTTATPAAAPAAATPSKSPSQGSA